jgi:hypothetical protein
MTFPLRKPERFESRPHLQFVRNHHCVVSGCWKTPQANHIVFEGQGRIGSKVADYQAAPFCFGHHEQYHRIGREAFERKYGLNLAQIVIDLLSERVQLLEERLREQ